MFKRTLIGLSLAFCLFLVSCAKESPQESVKDLTGYMMSIDGDRVLVTEKVNIQEKAHPGAAVYTITDKTEIVSAEGEKLSLQDLSVGSFVEVWHTGVVAESFPTQAEAIKVLVYTENEIINEGKAIRAAVDTLNPNQTWWIMSIQKQERLYEVHFSELSGESEPIVVMVDEKFNVLK